MTDDGYVRGEGPANAELFIIGEAPAKDEVLSGRPFMGPAGRLLNLYLEKAGIKRSECYVTNLVKVRAPGDSFHRFKEIGINPYDWIPQLREEIQEIRPNCIVACGANPLKFLTGRSGKGNSITENRGSILSLLPSYGYECKVVPTFHTAHLLRMKGGEVDDPIANLWVQADLKRAVEESKFKEFQLPIRHIGIARNSLDTWRFLERNRHKKRASVDCEVTWAIPTVLGLSFSPSEAFVIPLLDFDSAVHRGGLCVSSRDVADSLRAVFSFLSSPDIEIVGQNFKFDHDKLEGLGALIRGRIIDIMLLHHSIYPEFPKSLEFMASLWTKEPFWKNNEMYNTGLINLCRGCGRDACVTLEIANLLLMELDEAGLHDFYFGYGKSDWRYPFAVEKLHHLYREMEHIGFSYDQDINRKLRRKYKLMREEEQAHLDKLVGGHVNVKSPAQVGYLLYDYHKLPRRYGHGLKIEGKERSPSTSEDVLVALRNSPQNNNDEAKKAIDSILDIRKIRDTESRYLNAEPDFDGRMRTSYNIGGAKTGRTSTQKQKPPVRPYEMGLPFHTLTKHGDIGPDLRKQMVTDKGFVLIQADAKQAEARVVFLLAKNYEGLERMNDPKYDIHAHTASWFYPHFTMEDLQRGENKNRRFTGKTIRHAGHYDMRKNRCAEIYNTDAKKFHIDEQISEWKADQLLKTFHENDPSIREVFHAEIREVLDSTRVLVSPHGRRREFFGNSEDEGFYKEGYPQLPQATVADHTKRAMLAIKEENPDQRFILEWHDGFLALVPENEIEIHAKLFRKEMEKSIDFSECSLPRESLIIPCELEISYTNFYDLEKYELVTA